MLKLDGCADVIVYFVVSEVKYNSRITGREERLPMAVGLLGAPGADMELLEWTVDAMRAGGRAVGVKTGRTAFR